MKKRPASLAVLSSVDPVTGRIKGDIWREIIDYKREMDILDWGIRSMRVVGILSMKQMILVLRLLMKSQGRKRRFSTKEIAEMCQ